MPNPEDFPWLIIDPPSPFSPISELEDFRDDCHAALQKSPGHPQWERELERVEANLRERRKFRRIDYPNLNARQQENYNFQKVAARLADYGYNCLRLSDDWQGADFIACHIDGETFLKVQLKGRLALDKKYVGKGIYIAFFHEMDCFVYPHDAVLDEIVARGFMQESSRLWATKGQRSWPKPPAWAYELLADFRV